MIELSDPKIGVGKTVAILTSGGDSQGMNAAIRSAGRMCLSLGARVFGIMWGYQGLVDGGDNIIEYTWRDFSKIIHLGGTIFGSARCDEFRTYEGRTKAAYHLVSQGITHLIIIGGDGSLTGADTFRAEWGGILDLLVKEGKITLEHKALYSHLHVVGLVGSIDNDFCGTDMTIGTDSALHRIIECGDSIITTAQSHKRAFVLEIMGRHSGYLALSSGISLAADFIFVPENPPDSDWKTLLCKTVNMYRDNGKNYTLIMVAEGARDKLGNPITSNQVKDVLSSCTNLETRVTVLGHIQRGGSPSAFDRILATRQGVEAAINVLMSKPEDPSYVICIKDNFLSRCILQDCITMCNRIKTAYSERDIQKMCELRGPSFIRSIDLFKSLQGGIFHHQNNDSKPTRKFCILHVGAPASGMDSCTRAFTLWCISKNCSVIGIRNGFEGFKNNDYVELTWSMVQPWFGTSGSSLGISRSSPESFIPEIKRLITELGISGMVIVGGYNALAAIKVLHKLKKTEPELRIPIIVIPATISNSLPCTNYCLGSDTTVNSVAKCCDALRQSARSTKKTIFVVETMGKKCGYLALMSALASGGDNAYTYEKSPSVYVMLKDVENLKKKFKNNFLDFGLLVAADHFSDHYDFDFVTKLVSEEGKDYWICKKAIIGYIQQGSSASPFDRFLGTKFGTKTACRLMELLDIATTNPDTLQSDESTCMICSTTGGYIFSPFSKIMEKYNPILRSTPGQWWLSLKDILNVLSHSDYNYHSVTIPGAVFKNATVQQ